MSRFLGLLIFLGLLSCNEKREEGNVKKYFDIDSLINSQISMLSAARKSVQKYAKINLQGDSTLVTPDSAGWENELATFRHLDIINKPIYKDAYTFSESKDPNSNLTVHTYRANRNIPIQELRIYYLNTLNNLKRLEAITSERNALFSTDRKMKIEFDGILTLYELSGIQKMILSDTVRFSIKSKVIVD
ncbi:MAG: hypothetical protein RIB47_13325 [Cyclobacteriaceae bacterium]